MEKGLLFSKEHKVPVIRRAKDAKFDVNIAKAISEFENAMHKFPIKKILYRSIIRGKGLEFDSFREFGEGEDASLIDWKASLRANALLARNYIEERNIEVYFILDVSNSMLSGSGKRLKAEYACELVAALGHLVISSGDKVGILMVSDSVVKFLRPSSSVNQFRLLSKYISDANLYGGGFNLDEALGYILKQGLKKESVFILVSDFVLMHKNIEKILKVLGHRFEAMAIMVRDPIDESLPRLSYQFTIQDPYSGRQMIVDPSLLSEKYSENVLIKKNSLKKVLEKSKVDLVEVMIDKPFIVPIMSFLKSRSSGGIRR